VPYKRRPKKTSLANKPSRQPAIKVRRARPEDVAAIYACQAAAYASYGPTGLCDKRALKMQVTTFPEGQYVAVAGKEVIGYATSLIVQLDDTSPWYSYSEITGGGTFSTHDSGGDTLYGADIAVHPDWRGQRVAGLLYEARIAILGVSTCGAWWLAVASRATSAMPGR
jgi:ribosomal protein S18 acetylase RimI-like enzyme